MEPLLSFGQNAIIMVVGLAVRFLVAVTILAAIVGVIVLVLEGWKGATAWRRRLTGVGYAGSVAWLENAYYSPWHTWLAPAGEGTAKIGLDPLAERLLPHATRLEVVAPGTCVRAGEPFAQLAAGPRTLTLRAPADAMVIGVSHHAARMPRVVAREPYRRGWLAVVAARTEAYASLRHGPGAAYWLRAEEQRMQHRFEDTLGYAAADGGDLVAPGMELLTDEQWNRLVREFV